ncbi:hypothetical protein PLICRDRAFT_144685, partial [Plicaturopsis crispa FD-325 SS-3]
MDTTDHSQSAKTSQTEITDAPAPFDHPKADVILRSSDNVDFRAFKFLLSLTSTFFECMFTLPQPLQAGAGEVTKGGVPVIPMSEDSEGVTKPLLYCLPSGTVQQPGLETLSDISAVLDLAVKYDMPEVKTHARIALISHHILSSEVPLSIFAIAIRYGLQKEATVAARSTLAVPIADWPYVNELKYVTANQYHRLQEYHRKCGSELAQLCISSSVSWELQIAEKCPSCRSSWVRVVIGEAGAAFRVKPAIATAREVFISDKALSGPWKCGKCYGGAGDVHSRLEHFLKKLSPSVEGIISAVEVDLVDLAA